MNFCFISPLRQRPLICHFVGGTKNDKLTLNFIVWPSTIYLFPVCLRFYPCFLSITNCIQHSATSTDVERLFSRGRLILSHTRSRLATQSTRALLCLGSWSLAGLVKDSDVAAVAVLDEVEAKIELDRLGDVLSRTCRGKV